jgi:hypothetical protein
MISGGGNGVHISGGASLNNFTGCDFSGSNAGSAGINISSGENSISGCKVSGGGQGVNISGGSASLEGCCIISGGVALLNSSAGGTSIKLDRCYIGGSNASIQQSSAAGTAKWHISGCSFSKAGIDIDGAEGLTHKLSANVYMPEFANWFLAGD